MNVTHDLSNYSISILLTILLFYLLLAYRHIKVSPAQAHSSLKISQIDVALVKFKSVFKNLRLNSFRGPYETSTTDKITAKHRLTSGRLLSVRKTTPDTSGSQFLFRMSLLVTLYLLRSSISQQRNWPNASNILHYFICWNKSGMHTESTYFLLNVSCSGKDISCYLFQSWSVLLWKITEMLFPLVVRGRKGYCHRFVLDVVQSG